jgi:N-acetylglucosaminyldiphosphoundecaprenol N-acetyl-beta-D-mannosaminyltransferase
MPVSEIEYIQGIPVSNLGKETCLENILKWLGSGARGRMIVCANPHSIEIARSDNFFREALMVSDLVVPDGIGMVLASYLLGGRIRDRVTGSDIFHGLNSAMDREKRWSVFFLGSTEGTLAAIQRRFSIDYPGVRVAGTFSPPFRSEFNEDENRAMVDIVNYAQPDVLWVGMTAPKQEKWIFRNRSELMVKVSVAVGAVFDFYAGNVQRSSPFFQHLGLEWFPRLVREPGRLWRRNLISGPSFLMRVVCQRLFNSRGVRNGQFHSRLDFDRESGDWRK